MKKFLLEIKQELIDTPNSVKFWNLMVLVGLVISGIFSLELLVVELFIGSFLTFGLAIDGSTDNHLWMILMPITWGCMLLVGVGFLIYFIYKNTIEKFNNWLDK
jgi:hypothetical protein